MSERATSTSAAAAAAPAASAAQPGAPAAASGPLVVPAAAPVARYVPGSGEAHRHVLVAIVRDRPGVLNRVASLMRARNFNIESLAVGHTERPDISRMTITLRGDDYGVEQMTKQLYRLVDVLKVQDVTSERTIEHELALVKVRASDRNRAEIVKIVELYKGRLVDIAADAVVIEATGTVEEIDALVALVGGFGIKELVRTGSIVMTRGSQAVEFEGGSDR